ncbi:hypothetical protein LSG25_11330 [Paralcaligenes sp. KSB-10]|uniref:hypothetical protein n=1 Tax=Paralcaligenes sp. KSB-10 TaxID=2901142 RepID=UPI001E48B069|nr:hypothetical protein [Paralcaligenes sp. KSB-10]UHL62676.1 hypothetical protein LSG25_11330 [Paralcaligenes sp. KSB-10]
MAKQTIVWTVLPNGRATDGPHAGQLRVSIIASPRLTPEAPDEQILKAFDDWQQWPLTLQQAEFALRVGTKTVKLIPTSTPDPALWKRLLPGQTPVAGFEFKDMSQVNLRSYAVRNVLGLVRRHYSRLAVQSTSTHPTLLPWKDAHPDLKDMLTEFGTRTKKIDTDRQHFEVPLPGFDRLLDNDSKGGPSRQLQAMVFGPKSRYQAAMVGIGTDSQGNPRPGGTFPIRALPSDWHAPNGAPDDALMALWNSAAEYTLYQANRFYQRTQASPAQRALRRPDPSKTPAPPKLPEFDFHRIIASYSDYPELLRRLGLVIDCVLAPDSVIDQQLASAAQTQGLMSLELHWNGTHDTAADTCPRTAWHADSLHFTTRARSSDHEHGLLALHLANDQWGSKKNQSAFDVYQLDPDATALKTVNFLLSAQNLIAKSLVPGNDGAVTYTTGSKQAVAALRSGGLGVSRHGRAAIIAQNAAAAALKDQAIKSGSAASGKIVLFTEDVLRGYRVDVQPYLPDRPGRWYSLCQRHGTYRYAGSDATINLPDDEGYVKGASTTSAAGNAADGVDPDDHYLHESLFRWAGWSLVAPRPGRTLRAYEDAASGTQGETPEAVKDEITSGGNGLAVSFSALKGSLARLRFGTAYRFRARVVDLAGNSLSLEDPALKDDGNVTDPVTYWRFEPVDPPPLLHRARTSEGESLERLVIRSNWDAGTSTYLGTAAFSAAIALPASADFEYGPISERHVVPPKSSQLQCETHGLFDALFANPAGIKKAYEIAARDARTLYDASPATQIELVTPAALQNVATTTALPPRLPSADNPTGDRLAPGQYVIHREARVETPYLPDGAAGGFALRAAAGHSLPGITGPMVLGPNTAVVMTPSQELVLLVSYSQAWPDTQGLRIVLAERVGALQDPPCQETYSDEGLPKWDETQRVLTLFVPKGRIVRLRYSSFVNKALLNTFGIPDWVDSEGQQAFVRQMAQLGCNWLITPYRSLVLVHATQQPVCAPELLELTAEREAGALHASLGSRVRLHGPSTGKIEIEATWHEWVDDPKNPAGPQLQASHGALGEVLLAENYPNLFSLGNAVDEQRPVTTTSPRARGDRHEFGDTKFRLIHYTLRATTRFREYLPAALYEQRDQVTRIGPIAQGPLVTVGADNDPGAPVLANGTGNAPNTLVLASAPPDEPQLLYTLPTFLWQETPGKQSLEVTRVGNGLRVWLERPWFSSGDGELLGVVILGENQRFTDIPDRLVPLVTQWGLDPLWDTDLPKYRTRAADFPACITHEDIKLQEDANQTVHVVGHRVYWNAERGLWYADIELDPGKSYMPFVRLALVRYQPNAIDSAKTSRVVLADFAQVLPRRRASFQRNGAELTFTLRGSTPGHGPMKFPIDSEYQDISLVPRPGQATETGRNKVELVLQTRDPALDSDLAWTDTALLASSLAESFGGEAPQGGIAQPGKPIFQLPISTRPVSSSVRDSLGRAVDIRTLSATRPAGNISAGEITSRPPILDIPGLGDLLDPTIWTTKATLPGVNGRPARVAVREYERYYTDRSVPQVAAGATRRRRVVEERLVYTAFFEIQSP